MNETDALRDEQRRRILLLGAGAAVVGGWACASARVVPEAPPMLQYLGPKGELRLKEKLLALGKPHHSMNTAMQINSGWMSVLIGQHGTYLISNFGAYEFLEKEGWENPRLRMEADTELLHIDSKGALEGWLKVVFTGRAPSSSDNATLMSLGFTTPERGDPFKWIKVRGVVIKPIEAAITTNSQASDLVFRAPKNADSDQFNGVVFADLKLKGRLGLKPSANNRQVFGLPFVEVIATS